MNSDSKGVLPRGRLAFGAAALSGEGGGYGFGAITEEQAIDLARYAFERGLRVFDTAPIYGFGSSEIRLGKAFQGRARDQVFLVSKSGIDWHDNRRVNRTNDPGVAMRMLEQSLQRLQTDYIDLYMAHWPDPEVDIRQCLEVLVRAQAQGKIKHIGLCNTHLEDLTKAVSVASIAVVQGEFSLVEQKACELFAFLQAHEIEFMSWGSLCKGILSGRVDSKRRFDACDARAWAPWWKSMDHQRLQKIRAQLQPLCQEYGLSELELALGFFHYQHQVSHVLVGMRNQQQVDSAMEAMKRAIPEQAIVRALELIAQI